MGLPQVRLLADPQAELAKALGVDFDATPVLGSVRSKRCAIGRIVWTTSTGLDNVCVLYLSWWRFVKAD